MIDAPENLGFGPGANVGLQAFLDRPVAMQVVMADDRGRGVDQARVHQRALQQGIGRAGQAESPAFDHRLVGPDRAGDPDRLDRALDR